MENMRRYPAGTRILMIKGYKGRRGYITEKTSSAYDLYIIALDNGIRVVAGPSAFILEEEKQ